MQLAIHAMYCLPAADTSFAVMVMPVQTLESVRQAEPAIDADDVTTSGHTFNTTVLLGLNQRSPVPYVQSDN